MITSPPPHLTPAPSPHGEGRNVGGEGEREGRNRCTVQGLIV
jgi:hypothetical protein